MRFPAGPIRTLAPAAAVVAVLLLAACSAGAGTAAPPVPTGTGPATGAGRSIVVLGHSGATGYNSDPADRSRDARENSWATGTNPAVNSVYRRLVERSPEYEGHNVNLAQDGATVEGLRNQADNVAAVRPRPAIVLVEIVDNDIRCDGTDPENYAPFARTLTLALQAVANGAPDAELYLTSVWATTDTYARVVATLPAARQGTSAPVPAICSTPPAGSGRRP